MAADARTDLDDNGKAASDYINQSINDSYKNDNLDMPIKTVSNGNPIELSDLVGPACVVQDPGYNAWVCDSDTSMLYKYSIESGTPIYQINIEDAITRYLEKENDEEKLEYWDKLRQNFFISPGSMVLNSKNELYVTFPETQMLVKFDGKTESASASGYSEVLKVWFFQHGNDISDPFAFKFGIPDAFDYSSGYASGDLLQGYVDWKPIALDTNEYDDLVVMFQTRFPYEDQEFDPGVTPLDPSLKLVFFKDDEIVDQCDIDMEDSEIWGTYSNENLSGAKNKIDTEQVMFRSTRENDYVFFCGSIQALDEDRKYDKAFLWRFSKSRNEETWNLSGGPTSGKPIYTKDSSVGPEPREYYHSCINHMFMDVDYNLWFSVDEETEDPTNKKSTLMRLGGNGEKAFDSNTVSTKSLAGNPIIGGISQNTDYSLVIVDSKTKHIRSYDPSTGQEISSKGIEITGLPSQSSPMGEIFTNGDWSGAEFVNKYLRKMYAKLHTEPEESTIKVYCYDNYYVRKHSEEWDVAEHMKIPVMHTPFVEENPDLFKTIGVTLGVDEHKNYSIGKKLFEGIANQVANVHDMDECHVNDIYHIAEKEDVNIDTFINAYPEELKRMTDLLSIKRKKLWGDRCHCTQNYFKTVNKDHPKYCKKCKHWHTTNLGDNFDIMNNDLMAVVKYLTKYDGEWTDQRWYLLAEAICDQSAAMNFLFNIDPKIICKKEDINTMLKAIVPVNRMLDVIEDVLHRNYPRLDDENCSYDVLNAIKFIDGIIKEQPVSYLVEDKFDRDKFFRINVSIKSIEEAALILQLINEDKFLDEYDILLMSQNKTNDKIILYASILNLAEEARNICYERVHVKENNDYEEPKTIYAALSTLNKQNTDINEIYFQDDDSIPIDPITTTKGFAQKATSVVDKMEDEIKEEVKQLSDTIKESIDSGSGSRNSWKDLLTILREFNRIIADYRRQIWTDSYQDVLIPKIDTRNEDEDLEERIRIAQIIAIHTQFFVPGHWFDYCFWYFLNRQCEKLNTSVINWDSKYTTLPEYDKKLQDEWYKDQYDDNVIGTMEKLLNYILHNGTLFHENEIYVDD